MQLVSQCEQVRISSDYMGGTGGDSLSTRFGEEVMEKQPF
jgi:hypothetical protein